MEFIGNHNSPLERGSVAPVATLLRQVYFAWPTSLERLVHTPGQVPVLACAHQGRVGSIGPKDDGKPTLPQQIRSQDRARYEGSHPRCKGCSAARTSDQWVGDFVQHEVTFKIHRSDQHQQKNITISGNHGVAGMLVVQRHRLLARDVECASTARHHHRNAGLADLC